jgi:putative transposase
MTEYIGYYHDDWTHLGLEKETPAGRKAALSTSVRCKVVAMPRLGGLHHRYDLAA